MKKLSALFGNKKQIFLIIAIAATGLLLLVFPSGTTDSATHEGDNYTNVISYTEKLEERIRELCLSVGGVEHACVLVTLESGSEYVYADNVSEEKISESSSKYTSDYIIVEDKNGTSPVTVTEIYPKIRGVAVVCDGGDTPKLQKKLTELLSAALGISSGRIKISS